MAPLTVSLAVMLGMGSQRPERRIEIPEPGSAAVLTLSGHLATVLSNTKTLDRKKYEDRVVEFELDAGDTVGGLLFPAGSDAPLIIASFGFVADRWSSAVRQFVDDYVETHLLAASVLILDHPSSAPFLVNNGALSIGGYDEGRMLVEVARRIENGGAARLGLRVSSLHLLGVSLGGLGVIHALDEDARGRSVFGSALVFSGVTRLGAVSAADLAARNRFSLNTGRRRWFSVGGLVEKRIFGALMSHFASTHAYLSAEPLGWAPDERARKLQSSFEDRLAELRRRRDGPDRDSGNASITLTSLDSYNDTNDGCRVLARLDVPVAFIHAKDDPVVPVAHLDCVAAASNPRLSSYATNNGGHWGFARTYGRDWVAAAIRSMLAAGDP